MGDKDFCNSSGAPGKELNKDRDPWASRTGLNIRAVDKAGSAADTSKVAPFGGFWRSAPSSPHFFLHVILSEIPSLERIPLAH